MLITGSLGDRRRLIRAIFLVYFKGEIEHIQSERERASTLPKGYRIVAVEDVPRKAMIEFLYHCDTSNKLVKMSAEMARPEDSA